ncbi:MAG TPA: hypothetical protein VF762_18885 [Blastocatellia bacterium]|jgi:hypothetical protein
MVNGKKKNEDKTDGELTGQEMLIRITNGYIDNATDEQRRLIYECAIKILSTPPKPDEPENHADEDGAST